MKTAPQKKPISSE